MGVTLERVQNKFACIIGELCSEPLILSQFAIWVDLRIAEYKAKGAISLDCSGEKPSPTWLKGIQPVPGEENPSGIRRGISPSRHKAHNYGNNESVSSVTFDEVPLDSNRLVVEDAFAVKQEQLCRDDEVFPIGIIHPHQSGAQRKRTMEEERDFLYSDNSIFPSGSPEKCRRLSSDKITNVTPEHENSTTNQSLMSVISAQDLPSVSSTRLNEDSQTLDYDRGDNSSNIPYIGESATPPHSHSASQASYQTALLSPGLLDSTGGVRKRIGAQATTRGNATTLKFCNNTQYNTKSAVVIFLRWYKNRTKNDTPESEVIYTRMEDIPPVQLDLLLEEFFSTVKQSSGLEYRSRSIEVMRERLERHLRVVGYSESIVTSVLFRRSRHAFSRKVKELQHQENQQKRQIITGP